MNILVINCGSSSVKADVIDTHSGHRTIARVERIGNGATLRIGERPETGCSCDDVETAIEQVIKALVVDPSTIAGVGHRVVHGADHYPDAVVIDEQVIATIEDLVPLAPLHHPANLAGIAQAMKQLPDVPHVAVFDTSFHSTLPQRAREYALPADIRADYGIRRYGFHGISHEFVAKRAADHIGEDLRDLRIVSCHLGNGASVCAIEYGRSVETSMGLTPLEGLVMGTRSGDIDPGILLQLMRDGWDADRIDTLLNRQSGLAGLSGLGNDLRDIEAAASTGDDDARLALHVYAHRIRKYIGAYAAIMGGVDAIVFTAGIGENSPVIRHRVAQRLEFLGARFDEDLNRAVALSDERPVADIGAPNARCRVLAVRTDEQQAIAEETAKLVQDRQHVEQPRTIPVAVSARHVHLSQETVELLFGKGHQLTEKKPLSQPGQFACNETVMLVGPKRTLENVRVLGPARSLDQVEISRTDEFFLGLDAPVRASGDVANTPGIKLVGPAGTVDITQGVICAWRHIHMTPADADAFGVKDRDVVEVAVVSGDRSLVFGDVLIRVSPKYKLEMHIDTDEANAADLGSDAVGELFSTDGEATLRRRRTRFDRVD
jgi:acetate kinase